MFLGALKGDSDDDEGASKRDFLCFKRLAILATATSIDAIAVGASLAMLDISLQQIGFTTLMTFIATAVASFIPISFATVLSSALSPSSALNSSLVIKSLMPKGRLLF